jgi:FAD dependent oxidoreductase
MTAVPYSVNTAAAESRRQTGVIPRTTVRRRLAPRGSWMRYIAEAAKTTPVVHETEVLVVGGGPGGLAAALAAARAGAQTTLVDRCGCFGGVITQVGVDTLAWYRHEDTVEAGGIGLEFERRAEEMGGTAPDLQSESQALDTELFKVVADRLVQEAGVEPLLHCLVTEPIVEGGLVRGVVVESKSGRQAILAERVVDATGDADVAFRAGAPCRTHPRGSVMGVSVMFSCSGVDKARFLGHVAESAPTYGDWDKSWSVKTAGKEDALFSPYLQAPFDKARADGIIPEDVRGIGGTWGRITDEGEATALNLVVMAGYDCTDVRDLTRAETEGRRQALLAIEALRRYTPGFERARLRAFGSTLGTRDSRKIVGRYELTGDDVRGEARFEDSVGIFPEFLDGYGVLVLPTTGRYFQVPYGVLVPREVDDLLVAGRCVAGDEISHAAMRNQMCCAVTGQAAGAAAAVSLRDDRTTSEVDVAHVREELRRQGVRLD